MSTQTIFLTAGATSKSVDIALVQKAAATSPGDPLTGLAYNTASLTAYYRAGATGSLTAISLATQTVTGAYSSGGFVEISSANAPGLYRFDIPNAVIATAGEANIVFNGAANLATHTLKIIVTDVDLYDRAVNFRKALAESYNVDGAAPTPEQALMGILQNLTEFAYSGTSKTVKKLDGSTTAMVCTLDSSTAPTSSTRSS